MSLIDPAPATETPAPAPVTDNVIDSPAPKLTAATKTARHWQEVITPYKGADTKRSLRQLLGTLAMYLVSWTAMYFALSVGYWLTLLLAIPTAAFTVRLFMLQHDCGHGSFFKNRKIADKVGFWLGVITLTPYEYWRKSHAYHHAHSGDLDFRGFGDILTITVAEYEAMTPKQRFGYRIYRNPLIMLFIGGPFHFLVKHRFPWNTPREWQGAWRSVWMTNLALVAIFWGLGSLIGYGTFLMIQLPITFVAAAIGVFLFYVQHQFEDSYWHRHEEWNYFDAALQGSSHLVLPRPLQWLTASIGLHHVHHLNSLIPNYRLQECMMSTEDLQKAPKLTLRQTFATFKLTLVDEATERMISFREYRAMKKTQTA